jgi:hypothetical protein
MSSTTDLFFETSSRGRRLARRPSGGSPPEFRKRQAKLNMDFTTYAIKAIIERAHKSGSSETRFYRQLIAKADERFDAHLTAVKQADLERTKPKTRKRRS